jgi:hypothetical protein
MTVVNGACTTTEMQKRQSGWTIHERLCFALADRSIALDRELEHGGMSIVYLAWDLRHKRLVAVKMLRPDVPAGAEERRRQAQRSRELRRGQFESAASITFTNTGPSSPCTAWPPPARTTARARPALRSEGQIAPESPEP